MCAQGEKNKSGEQELTRWTGMDKFYTTYTHFW